MCRTTPSMTSALQTVQSMLLRAVIWLKYGDTSATACETRCNAAAACVGFVHVADVNCCSLKSKLEGQSGNPRTVAHVRTGKSWLTAVKKSLFVLRRLVAR